MSTLNVTNISDGTNSTSTTNVVKGSAKAWVNFNGTGTVAIREQYNVSSLTDHGTGDYTVNYTTAMADANYVVNCSCDSENYEFASIYAQTLNTTSSTRFYVMTANRAPEDNLAIHVTVFR